MGEKSQAIKPVEVTVPLPGYSPELNPDELLNQELKATVFQTGRPKDQDDLKAKLQAKLYSIQKQPHKISAYFNKDSVRYAWLKIDLFNSRDNNAF